MFVRACSSRAGSASTASPPVPATLTALPPTLAGSANRAATAASTAPTSIGRSSGSRPWSARAITSRSWASCVSRSTSSDDRGAAGRQLLARAVRRQRELELELEDRERRAQLVPGVGDERALARRARRSSRLSISLSVSPRRWSSSLACREPAAAAPVRRARDPRPLARSSLDRRERSRGEHVAGQAGEEQHHRATDEQQRR